MHALTLGGLSTYDLAQQFGTPLYVYDAALIRRELADWQTILRDYPHTRLCYAMKANGTLKLLDFYRQAGLSFDIVSGGELARLERVGVPGARIIFSGVGKSRAEIEHALDYGIYCFNIESLAEIARLSEIGKAHGVRIPVAVRVNPDIDAKTHPYISTGLTENKFGIALSALAQVSPVLADDAHLQWLGLDCHIGSNMHDPMPYLQATETLFNIVETLLTQGIRLRHIDCGGGIGVAYQAKECAPALADFITPILNRARAFSQKHGDIEMIFEPGRRLIAAAGTLITQVEAIKTTPSHRFVIVDAAMTELMRPALYQAYHPIVPAWQSDPDLPEHICDVVGPVCESADFLGKGRALAVREGDGLAIQMVGAYGFVMSSNYNARRKACEVWVEEGQAQLIRHRESYEDGYRLEVIAQ